MRKFVAVLLLLGILSALILPAAASQTESQPEMEISFDPSAIALRDSKEAAEEAQLRLNDPAKRSGVEDNLAFPGTMLEKQSFKPEWNSAFPIGIMQTGKYNQYYCLLIYKGAKPSGDPICTEYRAFGTTVGMFTKYFTVDTTKWKAGQYTAVTCTAVQQGNTLKVLDNTAFVTDIYCYNEYRSPSSLTLKDADGKKCEQTVVLDPEQINVLELGRSPLPSDAGMLTITCEQKTVDIQNAGGYIFLTPRRYGSGELKILYENKYGNTLNLTVCVDVCIDQAGHSPYTIAEAGVPSETEDGYLVKGCDRCNSIYRERLPSRAEIFNGLKDVPQDAWYYSFVKEAVYRNLFNGVSAESFMPQQAMTRGMLVTVLWRYDGLPEAEQAQFTDVVQNAWYAQAVNWAAAEGIVNGEGNGKFNPDGKISREQMATILYRYAASKGMDTQILGDVENFTDGMSVSAWAKDGLAWAIGQDIIGGVQDGNVIFLQPQGAATRAQVSAILIRFINKYSQPPRAAEYPDIQSALDCGQWNGLYWAYYSGGKLCVGGEGIIPGSNEQNPWNSYKSDIAEIEILYGITAIGESAFQGYAELGTVTMADSVTGLDTWAFDGCCRLSEVNLSKNLISIGIETFRGCSALQQIDLPQGLRRIGSSAFDGCVALKEIVIPNSVTSLGDRLFTGCTSLERAMLPIAVTRVGEYMFGNCNVLTEVELPACMEYLGWMVFSRCYALEEVVLPQNMVEMRLGTFAYCTSLKEIYVLSPDFSLNELYTGASIYEKFPFGYREQVTVYGYLDSSAQQIANRYGYTFKDIMGK